jgi:transcriptional regulator with PAS, ATPase and Fis domain
MRSAAETIAKVAPTGIPILILGEHGTGKELFAKLVHQMSDRRDKAFVRVNCAALAKELLESELFGHVKGSFTGAIKDHKGIFEQADNGTLFLDEIGELKNEAQAKLLRVLQEGEIQRVGSPQLRRVDVRIVAATNRDLQEEMAARTFREDLYYRLKGVEVRLPPFRERREEIPALAVMLLERFNQEFKRQKRLAKGSISHMTRHSWPGNVRDLYNVLRQAVVLAERDVIEPEDLKIDTITPGQGYLDRLPAPAPGFDLNELLATVRAHQIRKALSICNDNQSRAAELLGMSRQAVSEFVSKEDGRPA